MRLPPWVIILMLLVVAGYAVPYLLLPAFPALWGTFVFWIGFGIAVWLVLVVRLLHWNDGEDARP